MIRIATRSSTLALYQANLVGKGLGVPYELVQVHSGGDIDLTSPLSAIGGSGIFVKEVQAAVIRGEADIAVHSAKDIPAQLPEETIVDTFIERGDPRDALLGTDLAGLKEGAVVATGSTRRKALIRLLRPDLKVVELRGNIATRLERLKEVDAILMANAALERLGLNDVRRQVFEVEEFMPQVGQGAIAVERRLNDERVASIVSNINHRETQLAVEAERGFLETMGSGCTLPVGAIGNVTSDGQIFLSALIAALDGSKVIKREISGNDPRRLGSHLGELILIEGGDQLLREANVVSK
ncbi:MAG: hydroxymethylbilane synthase [Actinomycetota bacterium]|nr:hydroxymethylbilane synthase [Actinomycetota bacterium]